MVKDSEKKNCFNFFRFKSYDAIDLDLDKPNAIKYVRTFAKWLITREDLVKYRIERGDH